MLLALSPSQLSAIACLFLSLLALGVTNWAFVTHIPFVTDYFFGGQGLVTALQSAPNSLSGLTRALFIHLSTRSAFSFVFVFVIAATLYAVLFAGEQSINNVFKTWLEVGGGAKTAARRKREVLYRIVFRLVIIALWLGYTLVFVRLLLPFCISASRVGIATITGRTGWLYLLFGVLLFAASLHVHVIFMRLTALRLRVFGGVDRLIASKST